MERYKSHLVLLSLLTFFFFFLFFRFSNNYTTFRLEFHVTRERLDVLIRQFACTSIARIIQECRVSRYVFLLSISRWVDLDSSPRGCVKRFIKRYMLQGSDNDKIQVVWSCSSCGGIAFDETRGRGTIRFGNGYSSFVNRSWFRLRICMPKILIIYLNLLKIKYNIQDYSDE